MGRFNILGRVAAVTSICLVASACSEVAFTPAPLDGRLSVDHDNMRTDTFEFSNDRPLTKVDVLFVVDNSGSMADEAAKLSTALNSFVDSLVGVDWQIGITSTDVDTSSIYNTRGRLVQMVGTNSTVLTKATPNYESVFLNTVVATGPSAECARQSPLGDNTNCGSGNEQPIEASRLIVAGYHSSTTPFFRENADLVTIALSDEDEMSTGLEAGATTGEALIAAVNARWNSERLFTGFGIIIQPNDTQCIDTQAANGGRVGTFVAHLAQITNGETGGICDSDYGPALASIGQRLTKTATALTLSTMPVPGTITVTLIPADPSITWFEAGRTVRFSNLPAKGTRVVITYERAE